MTEPVTDAEAPPVTALPSPLPLPVGTRRAVRTVVLAVVLANVAVLGASFAVYAAQLPSAISLLAVAYTLGLRHALDADHTAAIDNVTRRLVDAERPAVTVGLYFSLGHSSVVVVATMVVAGVSATFQGFGSYGRVSDVIGTCVSASFLLLVGTLNALSLINVLRAARSARRSGASAVKWNDILAQGSFFSRTWGQRFFKVVDHPRKMFPMGLLFGLGFDTATEICLLGIAALQGAQGVSPWLILLLAFAFTCGMSLVDTADGVLMLGVYARARVTPEDRVAYQLCVTTVSFLFAYVIAAIELLSLCQDRYNLGGPFWAAVASATTNFGFLGVALLGCFLIGWALSLAMRNNLRAAAAAEPGEQAADGGDLKDAEGAAE